MVDAAIPDSESPLATIERWGCFEWSADGPANADPFGIDLRAVFRYGAREVRVGGFYDGDGVYRVRFMPDAIGRWTFSTASPEPLLDGHTGSFECVAASPGNHGPVQVRDTFHFGYADDTPFYPFGTTCYAWVHQGMELEGQTLETLRGAPFNKVRMCVFPKHYIYNENEPPIHVFGARPGGGLDFDRPEPAFFRHLEDRIGDLRQLGIEADVILFHPYDRWGYSTMTAAQDQRYLRYVVARLGAYRNIWWSLANEFDLMAKAENRWDELIEALTDSDPYRHLTSIHNADRMYDHGRAEITHVSIQHWDVKRTPEWRDQFRKPVVNDEPEYEGDIPLPWGNISARELVHRFWLTAACGGYTGHGETYLDPDDVLWWSKGGRLQGESPARIEFLRRLLEDAPGPLTPIERSWVWSRVSCAVAPGYWLLYFGEHQPRQWFLGLPTDAGDYAIDLIDPWEMEITPIAPRPLPHFPRPPAPSDDPLPQFSVDLPGCPYLALRVRKAQ